jgi:hypothetical protein
MPHDDVELKQDFGAQALQLRVESVRTDRRNLHTLELAVHKSHAHARTRARTQCACARAHARTRAHARLWSSASASATMRCASSARIVSINEGALSAKQSACAASFCATD